ncbi:MAG: hypothetical protein PHD20_05950 [Clostridia bacterium]|nr:hypothetical protein [Clostridia bacterium]
METISYNKIKRKQNNFGIFSFFLFIILGTGVIIYSMMNEPEPAVLGRNPLQNVDEIYKSQIDKQEDDEKVEENTKVEEIKYKIEAKGSSEKSGNFKTSISTPHVIINGAELAEINKQISDYYKEKAKTLKGQMSKAENKYTYKVTFKNYENKIGNKTIVSITVHERIIDDAAGSSTMDRVNGYNIDCTQGTLLKQEEAALEMLGSNYSKLINDCIKEKVISSKMIAESKYNYTLTNLEQFYIKEGKLHILLNEGEVVDKKNGLVDIAINN